MGIHPSFCIHEMGQLGTAHTGLDFIGIDDGFLDLVQHSDGLLHLSSIAHRNSGGIVNHNHRNRGYTDLGTCHSDDRCSRGCYAVDFHGDIALVIHQHIVDLCCGYAVATGTVNPDGDVAAAGKQLVLEKLRCDIIVKPALFGDGAVQKQRSLQCLFLRLLIGHRLILPLPELLHRFFPPFLQRMRLRIYQRPAAWSCCR